MQLVTGVTKTQLYAKRSDVAVIFGYKNPNALLKSFREYADEHANVFLPYKPYIKNSGMDTLYNILCFGYYFENKDLLEAGTRSIHFKQQLPNLKEVYQ